MDIESIKYTMSPVFEKYGITYAAIFGSFARGEAKETSDIDLMVRLGKPMGMIDYMKFINSLESVTKRKVDVLTEKSLNKHIAPYVKSDIQTIYEK
ncbi:nucleotidyltransferase [Candidatus Roizmanbacteria bacterium CG_4_9_14_0_2_um_filter_39_13]|uniref:Nucleotidyltransferase n=2 Tax=Candidatus Roizmaniibacteriota TaxID=1752723 RepID=A0A2M8F4U1_9BACT|nr:MAG: nucleotidyltransferase [Candidatus Roizmanbacteria bacterium CG_4_10_14_0_2_um_filter_39_12]PJC34307.1 MAG: nucleotidyltransferase [Candidatus Roizmanbacteria bacterium CG_4_9_14_0_2_um_filter_39_13]PJE61860.1 MAG: nucleotidyltransferase [Candidatus Roizmanbacteria bacterium CG10_big_fil_rev_8_21_14_0_10_39_12]